MSGTVDATLNAAGTQLTLVLTNTSANGAFTDATAPASMLLTHVGFQLPTIPTNINITRRNRERYCWFDSPELWWAQHHQHLR